MAENKSKGHYCGIGGQAVLEGVMMKNGDDYAVCVRKPDGEIAVKTDHYEGIGKKSKFSRLPFVRGVYSFIDSLVLGMSTLTYSASFFEEEEDEQSKAKDSALNTMTVIFSVLMALVLFVGIPFGASLLMEKYLRNRSLVTLLEGVLRLGIFLGYVAIIATMQDIRRVYMYHGAEHKCINCLEKGRPLDLKNVKRSSRLHKRCGTSFLLFVVLVSIVVFMAIRVENPLYRLGLRIVLIPVIAGISFELIRLAGRTDNPIINLISLPGMMLQKLTTREPDDDMILVAMNSVEAVFDWKNWLVSEFGYEPESLGLSNLARRKALHKDEEEGFSGTESL